MIKLFFLCGLLFLPILLRADCDESVSSMLEKRLKEKGGRLRFDPRAKSIIMIGVASSHYGKECGASQQFTIRNGLYREALLRGKSAIDGYLLRNMSVREKVFDLSSGNSSVWISQSCGSSRAFGQIYGCVIRDSIEKIEDETLFVAVAVEWNPFLDRDVRDLQRGAVELTVEDQNALKKWLTDCPLLSMQGTRVCCLKEGLNIPLGIAAQDVDGLSDLVLSCRVREIERAAAQFFDDAFRTSTVSSTVDNTYAKKEGDVGQSIASTSDDYGYAVGARSTGLNRIGRRILFEGVMMDSRTKRRSYVVACGPEMPNLVKHQPCRRGMDDF